MNNIFSSNKAESNINAGEAHTLWSQLQSWYDVLELTEVFLNYTRDVDLRTLLKHCAELTRQRISTLENTMQHYKIAFPPCPSKIVESHAESDILTDRIIYRTIFDIGQAALLVHANSLNICENDSLRKVFGDFLANQIKICDTVAKFGKSKGWLHYPPAYKSPETN
ncbi:MAG: DUF3231 family protein [Peptococcaceae bacterium]|jgi:hypothetical protein|nr:DUF3231 family protein [Peptococcaceae bacterium]